MGNTDLSLPNGRLPNVFAAGAPTPSPQAAPTAARQAAVAAPAADQAGVAAPINWDLVEVDIEAIDLTEHQALDGMLQNFLQDGELSAAEQAMYRKTRAFYADSKAAGVVGAGGGTAGAATDGLAWPVGTAPIDGREFSSVSDPIETTGDGQVFDNAEIGEFVKLLSASGDLVLQTRQARLPGSGEIYNVAAAAKLGKDVVAYDAWTGVLTVNGEARALRAGETIRLPDGGSVALADDVVTLLSPKGDRIDLQKKPGFLNITGSVSRSRKDGEVRGSLGAFDADIFRFNDMRGRSGTEPIATLPEGEELARFLDEWRVKAEESLLPPASQPPVLEPEPGKPETPTDPVGGGRPGTPQPTAPARPARVDWAKVRFDQLDTNRDGVLSGNEIRKRHKGFDADGNGRVTIEEFRVGRRKIWEARQARYITEDEALFTRMDGNRDGWLSGTELGAYRRFDKDGDGEVTREEFLAGRKEERRARRSQLNLVRHFTRQDANRDGYMSGTEIHAELRRFDKDGNGRVTRRELVEGVRAIEPGGSRRYTIGRWGILADFLAGRTPAALAERKPGRRAPR